MARFVELQDENSNPVHVSPDAVTCVYDIGGTPALCVVVLRETIPLPVIGNVQQVTILGTAKDVAEKLDG